MILPGIAAAVVAVAIWWTPESPRFAMVKHGYVKGTEVLAKVRKGDVTDEAREVMDQITAEEQAGQVTYFECITKPCLRKRVFIACWLQIGQQFTGFNTILMYAATMFTEMGFSDPFAPNMAFQGFQVVSIVIGLVLIDSRYGGRRPQLLAVTVVIIPLLALVALSVSLTWPSTLTLVFVVMFGFFWEIAWGPLPWVYPSEIFSISERDRATSLAVFCQYAANAVLLFLVPTLKSTLGVAGMFWFHALFNVVNLMFVTVFIKETKGVLLEDVPALFGNDVLATGEAGKAVETVARDSKSPVESIASTQSEHTQVEYAL
jgi:hypothetical protein